MFFVHRKITGAAIDLPGARIYNFDRRVVQPAEFKDGEHAGTVDFQIGARVLDAPKGTDLAGQIKQKILIDDEPAHQRLIAYIRNDDMRLVFEFDNVEQITTVPGIEEIDQPDLSACLYQAAPQIPAHQTHPACDQYTFAHKRRSKPTF